MVPTLLAVLAALSLLPAAPPRALWLDETFGLHTSVMGVSWANLGWHGAPGQGCPHPLYYLVLLAQNLPELLHRAVTTPQALAPYHLYGENLQEPCTRDILTFGSSDQVMAKLDRTCH